MAKRRAPETFWIHDSNWAEIIDKARTGDQLIDPTINLDAQVDKVDRYRGYEADARILHMSDGHYLSVSGHSWVKEALMADRDSDIEMAEEGIKADFEEAIEEYMIGDERVDKVGLTRLRRFMDDPELKELRSGIFAAAQSVVLDATLNLLEKLAEEGGIEDLKETSDRGMECDWEVKSTLYAI